MIWAQTVNTAPVVPYVGVVIVPLFGAQLRGSVEAFVDQPRNGRRTEERRILCKSVNLVNLSNKSRGTLVVELD